jgi:hypothetical protein
MEQMFISDGIPAVPWNRKLSEFRSEPFRGRENNSEFSCVEQKKKQTLGIPFRILEWKRKKLRIPFRGPTIPQKRKLLGAKRRCVSKTRPVL